MNSWILLASLMVFGLSAKAEKMDLSTTNLVIEKLTASIKGETTKQSKEIQLRLADLYSERARLYSINEFEGRKSCPTCPNAKSDRLRALSIYYRLFDKFDSKTQERTIQQISHLSLAVDQVRPAESLYNRILRSRKYHKIVKARVLLSKAENAFYAGQYKTALKLYDSAVSKNKKLKTPLVLYRIAWCHFNIGNTTTAVAILRNVAKDLQNSKEHLLFLEDLTKDYALFLSRRPINDKQLNELTLFSPGSQKKGNLIFLADELARYGKSVEYMRVYAFIDRIFPLNDIEKSHYQLKAAQSALSIGALTKAEQFYGKSLEQSKSLRCTSETQRSCDKLRKEQRDFLISWNNEEKTKPSRSLQNSYTTFMKYNPEDIQMGYWAAQLAHQRGDLKVAHNHYKVVSQESRKQKSPLAQKLFDQSLQSQIVIAESTGNQEIKSDTYRNYIAVKPDGKYAIESRYQLAYLDYEKKQYQKAQSQFEELSKISLSELTNSDRALIKKSADLNLDCLALLQEDKKIIFWSSHYSKIWPKNSNEFLVIKRRATLKYATKVHNDKKSDKEELQEALIAMRQLSFRNVSEKEQLILLTTQALIAEKIRDTRELQRSSKKILTYKSATASDRKFALRQLIWVAEVHLDFKSAYQLTKQLGRDNLSQSSYILRLALLADLAGVSPKNHYQEYLRRYPYGSQNYEVRARLVLMDRRPWKALNQHLRFLRNRPQILADLTFEIFAQHRDLQRLQDVAKVKGFRTTDSGRLLQRHLDYTDVFRAAQRLSKQKIISTNDRRLKQTLTARLQLINQMESEFQRASARKEWGIQTLALTYLRKEYLNLYNTITQLPIPRGLNKEERTRYQSALLAEANPYKLKSEKISEKLNKAWKDSTYLDYLSQSKSESKLSVRTLWATEAQYLSQVAPSWRKGRLNQIASRSQLNSRKISKAKNELKSDPFNADKVENLQSLVKYSGQESMSSFLSARLDQINKEKKQ